MKPIDKLLGGALLLETARFEDQRGSFAVLFQAEAAEATGLDRPFVQDNTSFSRAAGTVRGLHLQLPPWEQGKLVRVVRGRIVDVIVDLRPGSVTHGRHALIELAADDDRQLWIPPGFAHGFCTVEPDTEVFYKVDAPYRPESEWTLAWDDPALAVDWPVGPGKVVPPGKVVLSDKDAAGATLAETVAAIARAGRMRFGAGGRAGAEAGAGIAGVGVAGAER